MTEAGWTRGKDVKVEGWYWWEVEEETGLSLKVVQVEKGFTWIEIENEGRDVLYVVGYGGLLENKPGRFKGPITPDSYQQGWVAGLQEAGDLHEQVNTYCDHEPKAGAGGMGVAIRYRDLIRQQATKLAQQAQDEKGGGDGKDCL